MTPLIMVFWPTLSSSLPPQLRRAAWLDAADPEDAEVLYCLDLRPITCGLTWGRARNGLVSSRLLTQRCEPRCPTGYHVVIVGGIPVRGAEGFDLASPARLCRRC